MTYQECEMLNAKTRQRAEERLKAEKARELGTWLLACALCFMVGLML